CYADLRGYSYDRSDVTARGLANAYAQTLGSVFTTEAKPLEVELAVAEVGLTQAEDQIYRLSYDGSVTDQSGYVVMGGDSQRLATRLGEGWRSGLTLAEALRLALSVLAHGADPAAPAAGPANDTPPAEGDAAAAPRELPAEVVEAG